MFQNPNLEKELKEKYGVFRRLRRCLIQVSKSKSWKRIESYWFITQWKTTVYGFKIQILKKNWKKPRRKILTLSSSFQVSKSKSWKRIESRLCYVHIAQPLPKFQNPNLEKELKDTTWQTPNNFPQIPVSKSKSWKRIESCKSSIPYRVILFALFQNPNLEKELKANTWIFASNTFSHICFKIQILKKNWKEALVAKNIPSIMWTFQNPNLEKELKVYEGTAIVSPCRVLFQNPNLEKELKAFFEQINDIVNYFVLFQNPNLEKELKA